MNKATVWSLGSARAGWLPKHFSKLTLKQEANTIKMSPDWQGFMQLNTIIRDSEWAALWSRGSFFRIKLGFSACVRSRPASSYCLWKVPKRQPWGHGPHCAWYKQGLLEKEARFLSSRKSFLLSWNLKIPEGMKGQGRNEWRERVMASEELERQQWKGRDDGGGRRGETKRNRTPSEGAWVWSSHHSSSVLTTT